MKELIASFYDYGVWVNERLLKTSEALNDEQFNKKFTHSFESVHHTFVHMLSAETIWFARWQGHSPQTLVSPTDAPTLPSLRAHWAPLISERRAFITALDDTKLQQIAHWTSTRGTAYAAPLWQIMLHCANHATHHRSEIAAMLTELAHAPAFTDLLEYLLALQGRTYE